MRSCMAGSRLNITMRQHSDPSLSAMLVSKITNGYSPREVNAATRPALEGKMLALIKKGAMTASGPLPDERIQMARLIR